MENIFLLRLVTKEVILVNGTYVKYKNKEIIKERLKGCYVGDVNEVFE